MEFEELAREFLEEFFRLGRYHHSREISSSMKGEAFLLMYLWKKQDAATPGELGKAMKTSSARVAAALNNLERIELTAKGEEQARQWQQIPMRMISRLMEQLGEEDAKQMLHILKRINEIMPQIDCCDRLNEGEKDNRGGKDDIEV